MKKTILFITLTVLYTSVIAQNLKIIMPDGTDVTSDTAKFEGNVSDELSKHFLVINQDETSYSLKVKFEIETIIDGVSYAYCWDNCYGNARNGHESGTVDIAAKDTCTTELVSDYTPNGHAGTSIFKFNIFDVDKKDTTVFWVSFDIQESTNVEEVVNKNIKIYPNPASNFFYIYIDTKFCRNPSFKILTIDGKTVLSEKLESGSNTTDISTLKQGIYIVQIFDEEKLIKTKKLIIK